MLIVILLCSLCTLLYFVVSSDDVHISCCQQLPDVLSELAWKRKRESKMCLRQRSWCHSWSERIREDPSPVMEA